MGGQLITVKGLAGEYPEEYLPLYGRHQGANAALAIAAATVQLFGGLFPDVLPASNDPALSLTVMNASSTPYTLTVMTIATVILLPLVIAYQAWTYWVFRKRITAEPVAAEPVAA